ncbi:uncharacterized protein PAN0_012d4491 [Moesziomyces antarcticus]|uniref:Uncharacterized protein n=1 Tax=Pseudozyma antarctica TaxID=84753 RepID=A0A081CHX3_PSEA2|nr:uncharacterized protein PAN0_012d4491 [Moesziomyces antarcticus]GAK66269.1 hypothetical protein PAN0_012d4491 [Moesziomyces antarcticus]
MASAAAACTRAGHLGAAAAQPEQAVQPTQRTGHGVAQQHAARIAAVRRMAGCRFSTQLNQFDRIKHGIGSDTQKILDGGAGFRYDPRGPRRFIGPLEALGNSVMSSIMRSKLSYEIGGDAKQ